jgi:hypothetical protein
MNAAFAALVFGLEMAEWFQVLHCETVCSNLLVKLQALGFSAEDMADIPQPILVNSAAKTVASSSKVQPPLHEPEPFLLLSHFLLLKLLLPISSPVVIILAFFFLAYLLPLFRYSSDATCL